MPSTVYEELTAATDCVPVPGQSYEEFARALTKEVNDLPDVKWDKLSKDAQAWQNSVVTALNDRRLLRKDGKEAEADALEILELEGCPEFVNGAAPAEEAVDEDVSDPEANPLAEDDDPPPAKATKKAKPAKVAKPAKPAKKAAPAKAAKPAKAASSKRGRPGKYEPDAKITVLVKENPHRPGTSRHKRWAHFKNHMSVKSALAAGLSPRNLRHSVEEGHIEIA